MDGDASPRSRAIWAQSVAHTLKSPRGRTKFRHFLESEQPQSVALDTLDFWEQCLNLITSTTLSITEKKAAARQLAEKVELRDLQVNLNDVQLSHIYNATKKSSLKKALQDAMNALSTGSPDPDLQAAHTQFTHTL